MITTNAGMYLMFFFFIYIRYIAAPKNMSWTAIYNKSLNAILISEDSTHTVMTNESPKPHIDDMIYFKYLRYNDLQAIAIIVMFLRFLRKTR